MLRTRFTFWNAGLKALGHTSCDDSATTGKQLEKNKPQTTATAVRNLMVIAAASMQPASWNKIVSPKKKKEKRE
jgi:hypothetical protein